MTNIKLHVVSTEYEKKLGLPVNIISQTIVKSGATGAWAGLERGELRGPLFDQLFSKEVSAKVSPEIMS